MKNSDIKVGKSGIIDMVKFVSLGRNRDKVIKKVSDEIVPPSFQANEDAQTFHPGNIPMVVVETKERCGAKEIILKRKDGSPYPSFLAGAYLSLKVKIGDVYTSRPYSISSSPKDAEKGLVSVTVENYKEGFVAPFLYNTIKSGDTLVVSSPLGTFNHSYIRDQENIVALAGGSGITPFLSMAYAIRDGYEDFNLTILYGSRTSDSLFFKEELDEIEAATDKVRVIHVLSDEEKEGYEHGFINSALIKKYAPSPLYSVYACGPGAFYNFLKKDILNLHLPQRLIRFEMEGVNKEPSTDPDFPKDALNKEFQCILRQNGDEYSFRISSEENILSAIERAGIKAPSQCRSGVCGWCRSRVVEGKTYSPKKNDGRRSKDKENGFIHPCASFALSDIVIEVGTEE